MSDAREPRPSLLHRAGRACFRRHWTVIALWAVALVSVSVLTGALGTKYTEDFGDFHSEGVRGMDLLDEGFGGSAGGSQGTIVFRADRGVYDPAVRSAMTQFFTRVAQVPGVEVASPYAPHGQRRVAYQGPLAGHLAYADVLFPPDLTWKETERLAEQVQSRAPHVDGVQIEYGGDMFGEFAPPSSEMIGLGFAIVILIVVFGSVLAMGLPIAVALGGIGTGIGVIGLLSRLFTMPDLVTTVATMIGLGVGIDYALFIVTRVREDLHRGVSGEEATAHAIDTAGPGGAVRRRDGGHLAARHAGDGHRLHPRARDRRGRSRAVHARRVGDPAPRAARCRGDAHRGDDAARRSSPRSSSRSRSSAWA